MKTISERIFPQPTKIGTVIYARKYKHNNSDGYEKYAKNIAVYDIIHLNAKGEKEFLTSLNLKYHSEDEIKRILHEKVNYITNIFDIGAENGQRAFKDKFKDLLN